MLAQDAVLAAAALPHELEDLVMQYSLDQEVGSVGRQGSLGSHNRRVSN